MKLLNFAGFCRIPRYEITFFKWAMAPSITCPEISHLTKQCHILLFGGGDGDLEFQNCAPPKRFT